MAPRLAATHHYSSQIVISAFFILPEVEIEPSGLISREPE
jgi:hypothetical protein